MTQSRFRTRAASSEGFSLMEVIISTAILGTGLLALAGYMAYGLAYVSGSSSAVLAREKAREAVESVHTARDTGRLTWAKIQNDNKTGGVFKQDFCDLTTPGNDGLVNTTDDGAIEEASNPGAGRAARQLRRQPSSADEFQTEDHDQRPVEGRDI